MKIVPSPLVAALHGSAADVTCATWKGRQYARKKVIPANPQSAAQTLVRESMSACVTLWRSLGANIKSWLDVYGVDYRMSGFNVFTSKCRALEQAGSLLLPVPAHPHVPQIADIAFVTGVGAGGDIDVTWTDPVLTGYTKATILVRKASANLFDQEISTTAADEADTISDLDAGVDYDCYLFLEHTTLTIFGTTGGDLAVTTKA